jgi:hypothetical protein
VLPETKEYYCNLFGEPNVVVELVTCLHHVREVSSSTFVTWKKVLNEIFYLAYTDRFNFTMALPAHSGPRPLIQFRNFSTDGRTLWTSDQPVARPLPKHGTTQTQNKRIHTPNINTLSGTRTHDPSIRPSEDSSSLRPRGYRDRLASDRAKTIHPFFFIILSGVRLSPLGTAATTGLLYTPHMIDDGDCGEIG